MSLKDFAIIQYLIKEEKSSLIKVKRKKDGIFYLLKKINFKLLTQKEKQNALKEEKILSKLNHPNIIKLYQSFYDQPSNTLNLIMDYPIHGNLTNKIEYAIKNKGYLEECIIWEVLTQILIGLNYLHKKGIIHGNLQTQNIFLSKPRLIKITDFSCCSIQKKNDMILSTLAIKTFYTAPELLFNKKFKYKCDIWSVGRIIYEMTTLSLPIPLNENDSLYYNNNIYNGEINPIPAFYSNSLNLIIQNMLLSDPEKRPSIDILLNYVKVKETMKGLNSIYFQFKKKSKNKIIKKEEKNKIPEHKNNVNLKNIKRFNIINPTTKKSENMTESENFDKNKKYLTLRNQFIKKINNNTYRTLKERTFLNESLNKWNKFPTKCFKSIDKNRTIEYNNNTEFRDINNQNINNIKYFGSLSLYNANINSFFQQKFMKNFQAKDQQYLISKKKIINLIKNNDKNIKTLENLDKDIKNINPKSIPIYKRIFSPLKFQRDYKREIYKSSSSNNDRKLSYINRSNNDEENKIVDKNQIKNLTYIQKINPLYEQGILSQNYISKNSRGDSYLGNINYNSSFEPISSQTESNIVFQNKNISYQNILKNYDKNKFNSKLYTGINYSYINENTLSPKPVDKNKISLTQQNNNNIFNKNIKNHYLVQKTINYSDNVINGIGNSNKYHTFSLINQNLNPYINIVNDLNEDTNKQMQFQKRI